MVNSSITAIENSPPNDDILSMRRDKYGQEWGALYDQGDATKRDECDPDC
jgi:hypothetical protein